MRCYACQCILTPMESTRKFAISKEYTDMCTRCLSTMDVSTVDSDNVFEQEDEKDVYDEG